MGPMVGYSGFGVPTVVWHEGWEKQLGDGLSVRKERIGRQTVYRAYVGGVLAGDVPAMLGQIIGNDRAPQRLRGEVVAAIGGRR